MLDFQCSNDLQVGARHSHGGARFVVASAAGNEKSRKSFRPVSGDGRRSIQHASGMPEGGPPSFRPETSLMQRSSWT